MKARQRKRWKTKGQEWPLGMYAALLGGGWIGYLTGEMVFYGRPHPLHWTAGLAGALLGLGLGGLWYRWRRDR